MAQRNIMIYSLDGLMYGIDVEYVQSILRRQESRYIPESPNFIRGLISLREMIFPIIKTKVFFQSPYFDLQIHPYLIILKFSEQDIFGMEVDQVLGVQSFQDSEFRSPKSNYSQKILEHLKGFYQRGKELVHYIDIYRTFFTEDNRFRYARWIRPSYDRLEDVPKDLYQEVQKFLDKNHIPMHRRDMPFFMQYIYKIANLHQVSMKQFMVDYQRYIPIALAKNQLPRVFFNYYGDMYALIDFFQSLSWEEKSRFKLGVISTNALRDAISLAIILYLILGKKYEICEIHFLGDAQQDASSFRFPLAELKNMSRHMMYQFFVSTDKPEVFELTESIRKQIHARDKENWTEQSYDFLYAPGLLREHKGKEEDLLQNLFLRINYGGGLMFSIFERIEGLKNPFLERFIGNRLFLQRKN